MKSSLSEESAARYDRFHTDVNGLLKRLRKEIPSLQKKKLRGTELFSDLYIFWFKDEHDSVWYLT